MSEKQDKYLIWKMETLEGLCELDSAFRDAFEFLAAGMREARRKEGKDRFNQYIVCNQDEPYAEKVWRVILDGEDAKAAARATDGQ